MKLRLIQTIELLAWYLWLKSLDALKKLIIRSFTCPCQQFENTCQHIYRHHNYGLWGNPLGEFFTSVFWVVGRQLWKRKWAVLSNPDLNHIFMAFWVQRMWFNSFNQTISKFLTASNNHCFRHLLSVYEGLNWLDICTVLKCTLSGHR